MEAFSNSRKSSSLRQEKRPGRPRQSKPNPSRRGAKLAKGFDHLRSLIPCYPPDKKLTKIETLRLAIMYINDLSEIVGKPEVDASPDISLGSSLTASNTSLAHSCSVPSPGSQGSSDVFDRSIDLASVSSASPRTLQSPDENERRSPFEEEARNSPSLEQPPTFRSTSKLIAAHARTQAVAQDLWAPPTTNPRYDDELARLHAEQDDTLQPEQFLLLLQLQAYASSYPTLPMSAYM